MIPMSDEVRELLAEYAHVTWSGWMRYMFSKGMFRPVMTDEDNPIEVEQWIMPSWAVARWQRQMNTPYADLPETEKQSDREEADKILAIVQRPAAEGQEE
jgi:hypothetical protein